MSKRAEEGFPETEPDTSEHGGYEDRYHGLPHRAARSRAALMAKFRRSTDAAIPALLGYPIGRDLSAMITSMEMEYDDTAFFICALLVEHADSGFAADRLQDDQPENPSVRIGTGEAARLTDDPDDITDDAMRSFLQKFNASREHHAAWYGRLVFAQQHKDLNDQNIKSFFAQRKEKGVRRGDIRRIVDVLARQIDDLTDDDAMRDVLVTDDWMRYRTSAASTPTLVKGMLDAVDGILTFPDEWTGLVENALDHPGSLAETRRIPQKLVVITAAFHQAIGNYPDGWFQGNAARRGPLIDVFHQYLAVFQRLSAIRRAIPDTTGVDTVEALIAALGPGLLNITA